MQYFRCPRCRRWISSTYADVLRSDSKFQARPVGSQQKPAADFEAVKSRLERWLSSLDDQDPYRLLGVSPVDSDVQIKTRYRELAMQSHPDRGGDADRMRTLNLAYERILSHRARRASEQARQPALVAVAP
ncbi:MAG: J domain-containing protein [Myxococcota bacterium]|nr:J domain-containing protein [Myxococcota bacterium]